MAFLTTAYGTYGITITSLSEHIILLCHAKTRCIGIACGQTCLVTCYSHLTYKFTFTYIHLHTDLKCLEHYEAVLLDIQ